jgi:hypothetical protein
VLCRVRIYSFSEIPLIKGILYLKIDVNIMWPAKTKRSKALKIWHDKAMLIDPRKTEIEIIWTPETSTYGNHEDLRADAPEMKTVKPCVVEVLEVHEAGEDTIMADCNLVNSKLGSSVPLCSATVEQLSGEETSGTEASNIYEADDRAYELIAAEKGSLNLQFLRALEKTSSKWCNDKQLAKIVKKMEKGKNLKRKEFDKVYMHIRTYCGCN